ncbi:MULTISPECIES: NAD(P)H-dependent oxidoreductase [unclassified Methylophaga]|jgi:FMN-dependent NADH-azoreductase|uniref:FMN-dependent NADH-azoreductase n=1 Tax=unclassified Methylophaga TaxID=2629249 RepID=UPI000C94CBEC|nr:MULTISPECIES: NAD(P)H-dependent oxidoreductase [unclassified Methylophaga]MAK65753.1 FMN-dependent NADH-azoreductase [Methylophaga sp.]MAY16477.1 FMN-dependent NADH-azoreductase [Methylophaga sp.]HCD05848.1 FMN-dependent NADH-azoreductase [Methylophaga sp.]|tara:strand:+ start:64257 stop:64838 length:582 start_codon:yes stop_codon:yes gene_type:complete
MTQLNVLHINASSRYDGSLTRAVSTQLTEILAGQNEMTLQQRDVASGLTFIDENWINANFTDPADRNAAQKEVLRFSDQLINEVKAADVLVLAVPIYNFGIPAALKAWIDLVARARETFRYTEQGPIGLLENKKVYLVMASGGVSLESDVDFASNYLKFFMQFIGITDVTLVNANHYFEQPDSSDKLAALIAA